VIAPLADRFTFHTEARDRATRIRKTPRPTTCPDRYSSAISCLRSPALQSITGTPFAFAHARTRRANRPASRIRCASRHPESMDDFRATATEFSQLTGVLEGFP